MQKIAPVNIYFYYYEYLPQNHTMCCCLKHSRSVNVHIYFPRMHNCTCTTQIFHIEQQIWRLLLK